MLNLIRTNFKEYVAFLKNPEPNPNKSADDSESKWSKLFIFLLIDAILISPILFLLYILEEFSNIDLNNHSVSNIANEYGIIILILAGGILSPLIEEIIFRLPLHYKRNYLFKFIGLFIGKERVKNFWLKHFRIFFYLFVIAFGFVHIFNFQEKSILIWILLPLLVAPQIIGGTILGYLRIKLGFGWAFLHHAIYNTVLTILAFSTHLNQEVSINNSDFKLNIEVAENKYNNESKVEDTSDFDFKTIVNTQYASYNYIADKLGWEKIDKKENYKYYNISLEMKNLDLNSDSILQHHLIKIIKNQ
ncbi:CPBP family glutamic-type intramembrane protease [Marivirga arenosa]|uniref:CPBP family glutamic-type intramembrane protease n=1 Tax=Marivirga arenosa TaxID=3059076 RepID=A0AA49GHW1_9BACT|nr:CPBP family glutamic-type intramembrane protease [Marivirga sp. ABR2-2]WKK85248.2 CPBP family glutamic-type intramembrane protease [Marivirga sp. ABR2-2]